MGYMQKKTMGRGVKREKPKRRLCLKCDAPIFSINRLCNNCNESNSNHAEYGVAEHQRVVNHVYPGVK